MKLHNINPVSVGKIDVALASMKSLEPAQLEKLGAQLFADAINYPNIPLSTTAKHVTTVAAQLDHHARDRLIRGFFGTADSAAGNKSIQVFDHKVASATQRPDGTVVCELRHDAGTLYSEDLRALATRLAGKDVVFFAGPPRVVDEPGAMKAKPLGKAQKEALLAELDQRFEGIKGVAVKSGVLEITVGGAFGDFIGEALRRAVRKFVGDVAFKTVFDGKGDKPVFELSKAGEYTAWVDGQLRVPQIATHEAGAEAMKRVGDERVVDIYTSTDHRSLTVRIEPWATTSDAEQVMKKVAKKLGADAIRVVADSGVAFTSGSPPTDTKVWEMSPAEASKAAKAAKKVDAGAEFVGIGTASSQGHISAYSTTNGGNGNIVLIGVGTDFDMNKADALFTAVRKALGVGDAVPMAIQRSEWGLLASVGVSERKDEFSGLRDSDA